MKQPLAANTNWNIEKLEQIRCCLKWKIGTNPMLLEVISIKMSNQWCAQMRNIEIWEIQLENWTNPLPPVIRNEVANRGRSHVFWVLCTQLTFKSDGEPDYSLPGWPIQKRFLFYCPAMMVIKQLKFDFQKGFGAKNCIFGAINYHFGQFRPENGPPSGRTATYRKTKVIQSYLRIWGT